MPCHLARKALAGFFLAGLLMASLGSILPIWSYHLTEDFVVIGNCFLSLGLGLLAGLVLAHFLSRMHSALRLALACLLASAGLVELAFIPGGVSAYWRMLGLLLMGMGGGMLNQAMFVALSPLYRLDPASTVNMAGAFFGMGCVLVTILVAGTFYMYSIPAILIFIAIIPALFAGVYARTSFGRHEPDVSPPSFGQALRDFRSPIAVLFALLLFFQFGNEWAIAGWLPLYLIRRLGVSPAGSLLMLAVYWMALLVGRTLIVNLLPRLSHAKLLSGSVVAAMFGCVILLATNNRFGAVMGLLFVGGGFASIYPLVVEKIGGRFPYYHPGFFNGIFSFAVTGGLVAPWSLGWYTHWIGIQAVMLLPLLGTMAVLLLLLLIWAESRIRWDELKAGAAR